MNKKIGTIYWILITGLIIRLLLSFLPAFEADQNAFRMWSERLANLGPANFYSSQVFTNNPLGILYFFWFIGILKGMLLSTFINAHDIDPFLKLAANISDLLIGYLIYKLLKEKLSEKLANIGAIFYIFNPGIIFNSAIWGQYDSVAIFFLFLSIYYCLVKKSAVICAIFFSIACITKPQSLQLAPFLIFYFINSFSLKHIIYAFISFLISYVILFTPFFPQNPIYGIYYVLSGSTNLFNCTSCNALNLWGVVGNWQNDMTLFFNIPYLFWSFILLSFSLGIIFRLKKIKGNIAYFTISISMLAFFMLLTRMHERYIAYFFPFLLISAIYLKSKILIGFYIFFSIIFLLNLYIPYAYYNNLAKITNLPISYLFNNFNILSIISFIGFILIFSYYLIYVHKYKTS